MSKSALGAPASLAIVLAFVVRPALADEGMWTFDNFPAVRVGRAYGVKVDPAWLAHVQAASIRFANGCSASLVSGDGLVLTAYHCVAAYVQNLSTGKADYVRDGFAAKAREEERMCPGLQAEVLLSTADVTDRVKLAVAGKTGEASVGARNAATAGIEYAACASDPSLRCEVASLYSGGQFKLYTYRKYSDVRLVFAPESAAALFGGDPDNFNFPRYGFDISFVRLYENGKPVKTPRHLLWRPRTPEAGEPTFLSGFPGPTNRALTVAELETQRDVRLPIVQVQVSELRGRMIRFAEESPENRRISTDPLFNVENFYKFNLGVQLALNDKNLLDAKRSEETALRTRISANPELVAEIGDPWSAIARAQAAFADNYVRYRMLELNPGSGSSLYGYGLRLVRAARERARPSAERLPEYSEARLAMLQKELLDETPVAPALEQLLLEFWLSKTREYLTADDPVVKLLLGRESPEGLSARLVKGSKLADTAVRKALWDGGLAAIQASDDPMIQLVLRLDPAAREIRRVWENDVTGPTGDASRRIASARFAAQGDAVYPNGTRSLRISYGKVAGWTWRGRAVAPFTTFSGLFERATGAEPFQLAPRWTATRDKLDPETVLNFVTTNDVAPGNSGSPVLNAKGEILGVEFDGNIHAVGGDYGYDGRVNRVIAVATGAITEALEKVYGQRELLKELTAK